MAVKLSKLLEKIDYELIQGDISTEVKDIAYDSRKITEGMLFMAIAGTVVDGHKFIPDVIQRGAAVIVVEHDVEILDKAVTVVKVENGRKALSYMSAAYFDYPAEKMISIGNERKIYHDIYDSGHYRKVRENLRHCGDDRGSDQWKGYTDGAHDPRIL